MHTKMGNVELSGTLHSCDFIPANAVHSYETVMNHDGSFWVRLKVVVLYRVVRYGSGSC